MRIVKNGDVHVSAPIGMPKSEVELFIEEHRDWITEARKKTYESQKRRAEFYNQLPLRTRVQADDALRRLKALIEPMVERQRALHAGRDQPPFLRDDEVVRHSCQKFPCRLRLL